MQDELSKKITKLSSSSLSLYKECAKCFWLQKVKGIHRPDQNFALQNNFDRILKEYFDSFRKTKTMPPELKGKVSGELFYDYDLLTKFRDALKPILKFPHPKYKNFLLVGGIDDCLYVHSTSLPSTRIARSEQAGQDGYFIPIDFKTTGSSNFDKNSEKYYQHQLDIYNFLLEKNGYPHKNIAYLLYYKPKEVAEGGKINFEVVLKKMETNNDRALKLFYEGVEVLMGPMPKSHSLCKFCSWGDDFVE